MPIDTRVLIAISRVPQSAILINFSLVPGRYSTERRKSMLAGLR
jgi:hypothetical protein